MPSIEERLSLAPDLAEIARASVWSREAAARLAVPARAAYALDLCLEEALSNTIRHGFGNPVPAHAHLNVVLVREETALRVRIEDNAAPFDPCAAANPKLATDLADANVGGLGIHLMRSFTREMAYERRDGCNRLTLWFAIDEE